METTREERLEYYYKKRKEIKSPFGMGLALALEQMFG